MSRVGSSHVSQLMHVPTSSKLVAMYLAVSATSDSQLRNFVLPCDCFVPCILSCSREKAEIGLKLNGWTERNPILKEEKNHAAGMQISLTYSLP